MIQLALAVFGITAMCFAMGNNPELRMWAPIIGLAGQPFWCYFAWKAKAWGLGVLVLAYSAAYAWGIWAQWGAAVRPGVEILLVLTAAALAGRCAYSFGSWLGWVTDPEQWPRVMTALLLDLFRWDRQMSRAINDLDACAESMMADMGRAPRGTP